MIELQIFNYEGKKIRTVEKEGITWWVLRDVCDALGISDHKVTARRLDEDEVCLTPLTDSLKRLQDTIIINESGLYSVILRSDKPEAKPFRKWVTSEVLPAIRRTGSYAMQEQIQASNAGGIASLLKRADDIMKAQKASGYDRAVVAQSIFQQFGILLPAAFVQPKPIEQVMMERYLTEIVEAGLAD